MNNDVAEYLAANRTIENICLAIKVQPRYMEDLTQDIYLAVLLYPSNKLREMYDSHQLNYFLVRMVKNQYYGGPFYRKWRRWDDKRQELDDNL